MIFVKKKIKRYIRFKFIAKNFGKRNNNQGLISYKQNISTCENIFILYWNVFIAKNFAK